MMQLVIYEDRLAKNFTPIALARPVFELLCGQYSLRERLVKRLSPSKWGVLIRENLAEVYQLHQPDTYVNSLADLKDEPTLFVNGRFLAKGDQLVRIKAGTVGVNNETTVAFQADVKSLPNLTPEMVSDFANALQKTNDVVALEGTLLEYPWDVINENSQQIVKDFEPEDDTEHMLTLPDGLAFVGERDQIRIAADAHIDPYVVLDVRSGPVTIGSKAVIQAFTRIEGPCYIGPETQLFRANIREGTSIGPVCRIGGEIEASVIHGYANSYHDGFLGHSYVCPWVNMGALTTNSDLKNDYSNVRVAINGTMVDSGAQKVGCLIGDHTKTAIGTMFNTGTSVGVMSMVLPSGELLPKHIPSFCRMWHGNMEPLADLDANLEIAKTVTGRRNINFSEAEIQLYRDLFVSTEAERQAAIDYQNRKPSR